jgi:hypothetical protein
MLYPKGIGNCLRRDITPPLKISKNVGEIHLDAI